MQQDEERIKRKLDLLEQSFEPERQKLLDKQFTAKNDANLAALDAKIWKQLQKRPRKYWTKALGKT